MMMKTATKTDNPAILLVEDSPSQAVRFKTILEENGCHVTWAKTGEAGLETASQNEFNLIILDIELPGMSGFEVCRELKTTPEVADIPVVMLTTRDRAEDAIMGLGNGAVDYIPKDPFAELVLLETMKQMRLMVQVI
jgi:DNA-binding response OmpR family regulator